MTLWRKAGETQRRFVERTLRQHGQIATFDVLYRSSYEDGRVTSVTRLAAIIHTLRSEGWQIESEEKPGQLAVYTTTDGSPWACTTCGSAPNGEPNPLLGDMGRGYCPTDKWTTFRRRRGAVA